MSILKSKLFYIILVVILAIAGGVAYSKYKQANKPVEYETVKVQKGKASRTIEATGKVQSVSDLSLRFETAGTVSSMEVKEGVKVKAGDPLANLNLTESNASVAKAQADLSKQLAGVTREELDSQKALVDNAKASLDKARSDAGSAVATADSALATAKNNLNLAQGGDDSKIVTSEYNTAVTLLHKIMSVLDDAITQADNILGIDNSSANQDFDEYLSSQNTSKLNIANNYYPTAKQSRNNINNLIAPLTTASQHIDVDKALNEMEMSLSKANQLLSYVSDVLSATTPMGDFTQDSLNTKKTTIATTRSSVTTQYSSIVSEKQTISNAKNSYSSYKIAYDKAVNDLASAKTQTEADVKSKIALLDQALANYKNLQQPAREVDVASYRATLAQAEAIRNKNILKAPIDGIITKVNRKKGEYVSASDIVIQMVAPHYEIEVDVAETDIANINVGDEVEYSLDAFGDDYKLKGTVFLIDPNSTEIQDVVYYKVKISISNETKDSTNNIVKPGMTANVTVNTDSSGAFADVVYIPLRSVLSKNNGEKQVRVLEDGAITTTTVRLGSRVDNGQVIVKSGLEAGQDIVLSIKK
ncbi:MAG: HlyD family efflux transporter periplasmic adaptor subunit [bacterium]